MKAELLQQVKSLDPAPLDSELPAGIWSPAVVLQEIDARSTTMRTQRTTQQDPIHPGPRRRRLLIAVAAFAVALVAVGAIAWFTASGDGPVSPATTTTIEPATTTTAVPPTTTTTAAPTTTLDPKTDWEAIPAFGSEGAGVFRTTDFAVPFALDVGSTQFSLDLEEEEWLSIGVNVFGPVHGIDAVLVMDTIDDTVAVFNAIHDLYPDAEMTEPVPATLGGAEGVKFETTGLPWPLPEGADHPFIAALGDPGDEVTWTVGFGGGEIFIVDVDGQTVVIGSGASRQCFTCDTGTATPAQVEAARERLRAVFDSIVWRDLL